MKKILALAMIFMVSLVSFNANASPPGYDDLGINPIPVYVMQIDNAVVKVDVQAVAPLQTFDVANVTMLTNIQDNKDKIEYLPDNTVTGNISISKINIEELLLFSNSVTKCFLYTKNITLLQSSPLLCYTLDVYDNKRTLNRKTHSRYKQVLSYSNIGYGLWSTP